MNPIEAAIHVEEEKKKCIDQLKKYYSKHGESNLQNLYDYLTIIIETIEDDSDRESITKDLNILAEYLGITKV